MAAGKRTERARNSGIAKPGIRKAGVRGAVPVATKTIGDRDDETLTERAYRQIEELIVTLELPPETILSEQSLAQRLNIGRTPIREALQRLAPAGPGWIPPRRRVLVL